MHHHVPYNNSDWQPSFAALALQRSDAPGFAVALVTIIWISFATEIRECFGFSTTQYFLRLLLSACRHFCSFQLLFGASTLATPTFIKARRTQHEVAVDTAFIQPSLFADVDWNPNGGGSYILLVAGVCRIATLLEGSILAII
jgi:hypothetical protein